MISHVFLSIKSISFLFLWFVCFLFLSILSSSCSERNQWFISHESKIPRLSYYWNVRVFLFCKSNWKFYSIKINVQSLVFIFGKCFIGWIFLSLIRRFVTWRRRWRRWRWCRLIILFVVFQYLIFFNNTTSLIRFTDDTIPCWSILFRIIFNRYCSRIARCVECWPINNWAKYHGFCWFKIRLTGTLSCSCGCCWSNFRVIIGSIVERWIRSRSS